MLYKDTRKNRKVEQPNEISEDQNYGERQKFKNRVNSKCNWGQHPKVRVTIKTVH